MSQRETRFKLVYSENYERVLAYALRRANSEDAQDVVADTWLIVWRRLDEVPSDVLPWLFGVARKVLANRRRAQLRTGALRTRLHQHGESVEPDLADGVGRRDQIRKALGQLSAGDREALLLVAWDGLEPRRAAAALGNSSAAFSVRLHRARKRFSKELSRGGNSSELGSSRAVVEEAQ